MITTAVFAGIVGTLLISLGRAVRVPCALQPLFADTEPALVRDALRGLAVLRQVSRQHAIRTERYVIELDQSARDRTPVTSP